jgi:hypothetical protein
LLICWIWKQLGRYKRFEIIDIMRKDELVLVMCATSLV